LTRYSPRTVPAHARADRQCGCSCCRSWLSSFMLLSAHLHIVGIFGSLVCIARPAVLDTHFPHRIKKALASHPPEQVVDVIRPAREHHSREHLADEGHERGVSECG